MANSNGAFGLRPIAKVGQNSNSTGVSGYTQYEIASGNSNVIYQGSPVIPLSTGFIDIVGAAAGGTVGLLARSWGVSTFLAPRASPCLVTTGLDLERTVIIL